MKVRSLGVKLLAGFWATVILSVICVWIFTKFQSNEFQVERASENEKELLRTAEDNLFSASFGRMPIRNILARPGELGGMIPVLLHIPSERLLMRRTGFNNEIKRDILRFGGQSEPLRISRPPYILIGPSEVMVRGEP